MKLKERDVILKTKYSATLKSSAENFLVDLFEKISTISNYENVNLEVPISAAMAIITNTSWHQPTEAQIEYDFTRECIDKGIYDFQSVEDIDIEDEEEFEDLEEIIEAEFENNNQENEQIIENEDDEESGQIDNGEIESEE
jgi:Ser-tRNA(Ala) deacylase AlaX